MCVTTAPQSLASTSEGTRKEEHHSSPEPLQEFKSKEAVGEGGDRELLSPVNQGGDSDKGEMAEAKDPRQKEEGGDDELEVPEELEDIVDALLCGLRDRDTVVRWSAAKGIGRITERLPHELGEREFQ